MRDAVAVLLSLAKSRLGCTGSACLVIMVVVLSGSLPVRVSTAVVVFRSGVGASNVSVCGRHWLVISRVTTVFTERFIKIGGRGSRATIRTMLRMQRCTSDWAIRFVDLLRLCSDSVHVGNLCLVVVGN